MVVALGLPPGPKARFTGESNLVLRSRSCTICGGDEPDFCAVVDVGRKHVLGRWAAGFDPDVLALTHDDKDHIGGVADFMKRLRPRTGRLQELWVPYEWGLLGRTLNSYRRGLFRELGPSSKVVMSPVDHIQVLDWTGEEVDRSPDEHGPDLPGVTPLEHYLEWARESGTDAVTPLDEGEKERLTGDLIGELTVYQTTDTGFGIGRPKGCSETRRIERRRNITSNRSLSRPWHAGSILLNRSCKTSGKCRRQTPVAIRRPSWRSNCSQRDRGGHLCDSCPPAPACVCPQVST